MWSQSRPVWATKGLTGVRRARDAEKTEYSRVQTPPSAFSTRTRDPRAPSRYTRSWRCRYTVERPTPRIWAISRTDIPYLPFSVLVGRRHSRISQQLAHGRQRAVWHRQFRDALTGQQTPSSARSARASRNRRFSRLRVSCTESWADSMRLHVGALTWTSPNRRWHTFSRSKVRILRFRPHDLSDPGRWLRRAGVALYLGAVQHPHDVFNRLQQVLLLMRNVAPDRRGHQIRKP